MIHVAWPWMVLALPLPWLAARWLRPAQPPGAALFLPFAAALGPGGAPAQPRRSRLRGGLLVLVWLALIGAAVRPQWLGEPQPVATTGRRLLLAVDVSGSMATQDMAADATRLQVVQAVASDFISRRQGDQVGLILFGSRPYLQAPLTADLGAVGQFLREAMVGMAGQQTALGDAIGLALKRLRDGDRTPGSGADRLPDGEAGPPPAPPPRGDTVLVLLTDGSSNAGVMQPLDAARLAAAAGLRIYTIGVGAPPDTGFFGFSRGSDLDEDTLQAIAQATGGAYFRATDAQALQQVYARIDQLEPSAGRAQWFRPRDEWFAWPLAVALLLSVPAVLMSRREPPPGRPPGAAR